MDILSIIVAGVSMCGTAVAIFFAFKNGKRNDNGDFKDRIVETTKITLMLENIGKGIEDIKKTIDEINKRVQAHNNKLIEHDMQIQELLRRVKELESDKKHENIEQK